MRKHSASSKRGIDPGFVIDAIFSSAAAQAFMHQRSYGIPEQSGKLGQCKAAIEAEANYLCLGMVWRCPLASSYCCGWPQIARAI